MLRLLPMIVIARRARHRHRHRASSSLSSHIWPRFDGLQTLPSLFHGDDLALRPAMFEIKIRALLGSFSVVDADASALARSATLPVAPPSMFDSNEYMQMAIRLGAFPTTYIIKIQRSAEMSASCGRRGNDNQTFLLEMLF